MSSENIQQEERSFFFAVIIQVISMIILPNWSCIPCTHISLFQCFKSTLRSGMGHSQLSTFTDPSGSVGGASVTCSCPSHWRCEKEIIPSVLQQLFGYLQAVPMTILNLPPFSYPFGSNSYIAFSKFLLIHLLIRVSQKRSAALLEHGAQKWIWYSSWNCIINNRKWSKNTLHILYAVLCSSIGRKPFPPQSMNINSRLACDPE